MIDEVFSDFANSGIRPLFGALNIFLDRINGVRFPGFSRETVDSD
jgi:hypothetical protein